MRLSIGLTLALLCSPALAQPQPRIVLDVPLPPPPEHQLSGLGPPGRLAVGPDGTHYVLATSFKPSVDGILPAADARAEIMAFTRNGKAGYRAMLPVQAGIGKRGFDAASLGVAVLPNGETMVFLSSSNQAMATPQRERSVTSIYRISAAGSVVRSTPVAPAASGSPASFYRTKFYLATSDNGLLVAGGFGPDPFNWWIGKFDTEGRRLDGRLADADAGHRRGRPRGRARRGRVPADGDALGHRAAAAVAAAARLRRAGDGPHAARARPRGAQHRALRRAVR
ncbi:MAG: hypothetical protein IBJ17_15015, partial [Reyranella sp.]|nr:hypothetical protein [Reyranella sp.]